MPIQPLSATDIRALGSSLVLYDARSVIKELIENALDARANAILIEISANTLDVVQVKDNGSGIPAEDRQLLCKMGCTSKIRTVQDLETLGGSSLGFRGEALASVAALSNAVTVTTKIDGELVGSTSKFGSNGQFLSSSSASHATGTTIRVQDFLKVIPVRRQTALKAASRTLTDIKRLLQSYAFARPNVRYSFKVLRAQNDKHNWTYSASMDSAPLLSATAKIMGQEVSAQSESKVWTSAVEDTPEATYRIDAVVAKADGDHKKISAKGYFISVDGRPVSATRGVFRDFVKLYKTYFRYRASVAKSMEISADPFLCLHLLCPSGSYDVNVEPAKDEVLFTDRSKIESLLQQFLQRVYGALPQPDEIESHDHHCPDAKLSDMSRTRPLDHDSECQVSSRREQSNVFFPGVTVSDQYIRNGRVGFQDCGRPLETAEIFDKTLNRDDIHTFSEGDASDFSPKLHRNMYEFDDDDLGTPQRSQCSMETNQVEDADAELRASAVTNPWTIAKLNVPLSTSKTSAEKRVGRLEYPDIGSKVTTSNFQTKGKLLDREAPDQDFDESSPSFSPPVYQNPGPPLRRRAPFDRRGTKADDITFTQDPNDCSAIRHTPESTGPLATSSLQILTQSTLLNRQALPDDDRFHPFGDATDGSPIGMQSTQLTDATDESARKSRSPSTARKPFAPPFRTPEKAPALYPPPILTPATSPFSEHQSSTRQSEEERPIEKQRSSSTAGPSPMPLSFSHQHPLVSPPRLHPSPRAFSTPFRQKCPANHADLDEIMDFEHRKKAANAQRKNQMRLTQQRFNPGHLAQIQRQSAVSTKTSDADPKSGNTSEESSRPQVALRDDPTDLCDPAGSFLSRSQETSCQQPLQSSAAKQGPHYNRYRAAKAALNRPESQLELPHSHDDTQNSILLEDMEASEKIPPLPMNDPRAYLSKNRVTRSAEVNDQSNATITRRKTTRAKTSQLPFESIPPGASIHKISARSLSPFPSSQDIEARIVRLKRCDLYLTKGVNELMTWDPYSKDLDVWKERVCHLIVEGYVARGVGGSETVISADNAKARLNLAATLRAHAEEFASEDSSLPGKI